MSDKIYVIAGTFNEFDYYTRKKYADVGQGQQYVYVQSIDNLRGVEDPQGVFIGSFRNRSDINQILFQLAGCMRKKRMPDALKILWKELEV